MFYQIFFGKTFHKISQKFYAQQKNSWKNWRHCEIISYCFPRAYPSLCKFVPVNGVRHQEWKRFVAMWFPVFGCGWPDHESRLIDKFLSCNNLHLYLREGYRIYTSPQLSGQLGRAKGNSVGSINITPTLVISISISYWIGNP